MWAHSKYLYVLHLTHKLQGSKNKILLPFQLEEEVQSQDGSNVWCSKVPFVMMNPSFYLPQSFQIRVINVWWMTRIQFVRLILYFVSGNRRREHGAFVNEIVRFWWYVLKFRRDVLLKLWAQRKWEHVAFTPKGSLFIRGWAFGTSAVSSWRNGDACISPIS